MQYLHTMIDHQLQKQYKLYKVNAKEMSQRLQVGYNLSPMVLQLFNSDSKLAETIMKIKQRKMNGIKVNSDDLLVKEARSIVKEIKQNQTEMDGMTKKGISFGYELMPIAASCDGKFENHDSKLELLDGFKRMFCNDEVPDIDILVKVYPPLNDREWINAMMIYNSWKFVDNEGTRKYMDRGFQLGLYHRYRLLFATKMALPEYSMFHALNIYTKGNDLESYRIVAGSAKGTYKTLWNNEWFHDDVKAIYEILTSQPTFQVKKKGQVEQYETTDRKYGANLYRILEVFVSLLGQIRRLELSKGIEKRKRFDRSILTNYFADPNLQKDFVKIINMKVDGFIVNYVRDHLREDIKKRTYEGMGYKYVPKEKKVMQKVDWKDIKL
ncbi:hypothetical protein PP175_25925 (plasmid) [Aneurinibacillus sp. Ricciae_BoGa-3]|uniref:hypothetical protein n=1 Tax=Aneurinibacillus sp. Ricciae_BoGa-3 TaxID=3022697 RepID=UPI00233FC4C4|nr:hypothetical protein [Aneurinibacillus sp. Ricciae_BoGa-3]WCK57508.1 hypothetical protein PP175_25925 [Aneurinibacillus sp. Ricciae_BoGa-3]